jgi:sugar lactone lactonase YvrE
MNPTSRSMWRLTWSGNIYINNATTNTVQKFNSTWVPQAEWAGNGSPFSGALGIGVNTGGEVCVADTGNNRIQRFQTNGTYMSTLPVPSVTPYSFGGPKDVANESTGKMYVADTNNNRILKYKSDNTFDWAIGLPTPVVVVDPGTPTPVAPTGPYFLNPYGITVDSQNKIYVADSGHHRILKFDANGLVPTMGAAAWGEYGSADDRPIPPFDNPQGMAIEETGTLGEYFIYVADTGNNRIQRFDQDGNKTPETDVWGVYGTEDGQFNEPRNIALDSSNRIYVSEVQNRRVQVFGDADENAGLTVIETGATAVTEDGSVYDSYSVKLNSQPSANVSVNIVSSDSAQLDVSSSTLTFTPYNWNVAQVVTVIPVHDFVDRSTTQSLMLTHTSVSADPNYHSNGEVLATVNVTYTDTDTAGATFSKTTFNVDEDGTTDTYTLRLNSKPTDDVVVTITSSDGQTLSDGYNPLTVTFTPSNWNVEESIIVSAVHDYVANGSRESYFTYDAASSISYMTHLYSPRLFTQISRTRQMSQE